MVVEYLVPALLYSNMPTDDSIRPDSLGRSVSHDHISIERSRTCIDLCKKHGYPYFDIADHGIEKAQLLAFEHLLHKKV